MFVSVHKSIKQPVQVYQAPSFSTMRQSLDSTTRSL